MSGSDQEETLEAQAGTPAGDRAETAADPAETPAVQAETPATDRVGTPVDQAGTPADQPGAPAEAADSPGSARPGLAPSQARRLRIAAASLLMVALAVVLVVRLASRSSVLVVGVYGLALILCGVVIELSRRGRTRLGSWLLGMGLLAALAADRFLIP
ncbi:hypothetical protein ABCR94_14370 [Streptomyces sp. 21So2-11]|uniref:hypothetical protein n=1 Tax=Streptomyces sp. 21So2-11 TaxID=3144408 RepID=UPI00321ADD87